MAGPFGKDWTAQSDAGSKDSLSLDRARCAHYQGPIVYSATCRISKARTIRRGLRFGTLMLAWIIGDAISCAVYAESPKVNELIVRFQSASEFWQQGEVADELVKVATLSDISSLEWWLSHEDRRLRGNAAYVFAKLGDQRGFDILLGVLSDFSEQRAIHPPNMISVLTPTDGPGQERAMAAYMRSPGVVHNQIMADRYYAVHLLGELRDERAVSVLIPLLDHDEVNYKVAWALGEIGDHRAVPALIAALSNFDAYVRVNAIHALEKMRAREALPHLARLFGDKAFPNAGDRIPVGTVARRAVETIDGIAVPHF